MRTRITLLFLSAIISSAFILHPASSFLIGGKTWYYHSISDDYMELKLSKPGAGGNGTFSWITGKGITDKKEGKYGLKSNLLTLYFYWTGVNTITKYYRIEHETKNGFLLVEQPSGMNNKTRSFLFTSAQ